MVLGTYLLFASSNPWLLIWKWSRATGKTTVVYRGVHSALVEVSA